LRIGVVKRGVVCVAVADELRAGGVGEELVGGAVEPRAGCGGAERVGWTRKDAVTGGEAPSGRGVGRREDRASGGVIQLTAGGRAFLRLVISLGRRMRRPALWRTGVMFGTAVSVRASPKDMA